MTGNVNEIAYKSMTKAKVVISKPLPLAIICPIQPD